MDDDERPMHEDQDGVWYGRVTTNSDALEELMLDSAGCAHDTGRRVRKKDREEIQPMIKWIEKSKQWNDWANVEDDGEGDRTHQDEQQSTTTLRRSSASRDRRRKCFRKTNTGACQGAS